MAITLRNHQTTPYLRKLPVVARSVHEDQRGSAVSRRDHVAVDPRLNRWVDIISVVIVLVKYWQTGSEAEVGREVSMRCERFKFSDGPPVLAAGLCGKKL